MKFYEKKTQNSIIKKYITNRIKKIKKMISLADKCLLFIYIFIFEYHGTPTDWFLLSISGNSDCF